MLLNAIFNKLFGGAEALKSPTSDRACIIDEKHKSQRDVVARKLLVVGHSVGIEPTTERQGVSSSLTTCWTEIKAVLLLKFIKKSHA